MWWWCTAVQCMVCGPSAGPRWQDAACLTGRHLHQGERIPKPGGLCELCHAQHKHAELPDAQVEQAQAPPRPLPTHQQAGGSGRALGKAQLHGGGQVRRPRAAAICGGRHLHKREGGRGGQPVCAGRAGKCHGGVRTGVRPACVKSLGACVGSGQPPRSAQCRWSAPARIQHPPAGSAAPAPPLPGTQPPPSPPPPPKRRTRNAPAQCPPALLGTCACGPAGHVQGGRGLPRAAQERGAASAVAAGLARQQVHAVWCQTGPPARSCGIPQRRKKAPSTAQTATHLVHKALIWIAARKAGGGRSHHRHTQVPYQRHALALGLHELCAGGEARASLGGRLFAVTMCVCVCAPSVTGQWLWA